MRKLWLVSKFMTSQTRQQIITIHILANISRSKGIQVMKVVSTLVLTYFGKPLLGHGIKRNFITF